MEMLMEDCEKNEGRTASCPGPENADDVGDVAMSLYVANVRQLIIRPDAEKSGEPISPAFAE
jgi:hypothetical protein